MISNSSINFNGLVGWISLVLPSRPGLGPTRLPRAHEAKASNLSELREVPLPRGGNDAKRRQSPDMILFYSWNMMGNPLKSYVSFCAMAYFREGCFTCFPFLCRTLLHLVLQEASGNATCKICVPSPASWDCIIPDRRRKSSELPTQKHNSSGLSLLSRLLFSFWQFLPITKNMYQI